jgi:photosystem II stability/assembly factor-like uncharacterized protein
VKKNIFFVFILLSLFVQDVLSQGAWHVLPNSPYQPFRQDDAYFITPDIGWVVNIRGEIWKTADGGDKWKQLMRTTTAYRCVGFTDSLHGFVGNLGPAHWANSRDTTPLYKTSDGGKTWTGINTFDGPKPKGLCGMCVVNSSVIVGVGRLDGPAIFIRSVDGGKTWQSKDMSTYAGMLIDVWFSSKDTGYAVGGSSSMRGASHAVVLYTTDGGTTWVTKIKIAKKGSYCWKISHPSKQYFYVSIEEQLMSDTLRFMKSTDGGKTFTENVVGDQLYGYSQGIGFINNKTGWIGGSPDYTLETDDGGKTFTRVDTKLLINMNRVRVINSHLAYAVGQRVYKYYIDKAK